ncbi:hypothetical protein PF010_g4794 [Phytophthora fragariae]|uniref:Uncharacterized protein n=1 Tax=Phytophthora fragariae TaxID=53985 RepID=A0A6G0LR45_9STRA|nr:hypothetical protein PF010_g4794 [Phytophthora fragariae]KAE9242588.1 hypothetical protein PF004_g6538 [Phytophthora fragariae]
MKQPLQKMKDEKAAEDQRAYLSYSFSRSTGRRKAEHEQDDLKLWSQTAFGKAQEKKSKELKELGVVPPPQASTAEQAECRLTFAPAARACPA